MLLNDPLSFLKKSGNKPSIAEVAIADLGDFQIAVPTSPQMPSQACWPKSTSASQREYSQEGWVIYRDKVVGSLSHLHIGAATTTGTDFRPIKRLAPAVPIAFEMRSRRPLPAAIAKAVKFAYQYRYERSAYYAVFRKVLPKFVKVYPLEGSLRRQIVLKASQLRIDEAEFITQNREHLKNVPFYRDNFHLDDN